MSQQAVVIGTANEGTCGHQAPVNERQRQAMEQYVDTLVCNLPDDHPGPYHFDYADGLLWMTARDWLVEQPDTIDDTDEHSPGLFKQITQKPDVDIEYTRGATE